MADEKKNEKDVEKKFTPVSDSAEKKKDSGRPGGGAGRREEAGGSGVYPASGPQPEGNAPLRGEGSWGQGERGEEGYKDSGDSELTSYGGVSDLGGDPDKANVKGTTPQNQPPSGKQGKGSGNKPDLDPDHELPSGEDAHDRRADAREASQ